MTSANRSTRPGEPSARTNGTGRRAWPLMMPTCASTLAAYFSLRSWFFGDSGSMLGRNTCSRSRGTHAGAYDARVNTYASTKPSR